MMAGRFAAGYIQVGFDFRFKNLWDHVESEGWWGRMAADAAEVPVLLRRLERVSSRADPDCRVNGMSGVTALLLLTSVDASGFFGRDSGLCQVNPPQFAGTYLPCHRSTPSLKSSRRAGTLPSSTVPLVAYDLDTAERVRAIIGPRPDLREKSMFGGLAFMVSGNLAIGLMGSMEGLIVRVDPADQPRLRSLKGVGPFVMRGREAKGWVVVDLARLRSTRDLSRWVERGLAFVDTLPAK